MDENRIIPKPKNGTTEHVSDVPPQTALQGEDLVAESNDLATTTEPASEPSDTPPRPSSRPSMKCSGFRHVRRGTLANADDGSDPYLERRAQMLGTPQPFAEVKVGNK